MSTVCIIEPDGVFHFTDNALPHTQGPAPVLCGKNLKVGPRGGQPKWFSSSMPRVVFVLHWARPCIACLEAKRR